MNNYERIKKMNFDEFLNEWYFGDLSKFCLNRKCIDNCLRCHKEWLSEECENA